MIDAEDLSEVQVPCRVCATLTKEWRANRADYRFPRPFESESKGLCDGCKAQLYLRRFAGLQRAYRDWLTVTYPTPSFVYGLIDPRIRDVHYIGRTADIAKRMVEHRRGKAKELLSDKRFWIQELHALGLTFEHCILAVADPGYHVIQLETRWIAEGIRRGWPLTNGEMAEPKPGGYERRSPLVRRVQEQQNIDFLTCDESNLHFPYTIYRIRAYAAWSEQMLPALPHWFESKGAKGLMAHELDW
jgi:hypothetical protein